MDTGGVLNSWEARDRPCPYCRGKIDCLAPCAVSRQPHGTYGLLFNSIWMSALSEAVARPVTVFHGSFSGGYAPRIINHIVEPVMLMMKI